MNVDEGTAAILRRWRVLLGEERLAFGPAYSDEGWLVAEADGSLVQPDTLSVRQESGSSVSPAFGRSDCTVRGIRTRRLHLRREPDLT